MSNKYVVTWVTVYKDNEYINHTEPVYYEGTLGELEQEFRDIWKTVDMRWKMISFLRRLNDDKHTLMSSYWSHGQMHYEVMIGSKSWHACDFGTKEATNMPTIQTIDDWFYYESCMDLM